MKIRVHPATIEDCDILHAFIEELARSLNLSHKMQSHPDDLRRDGFGREPKFKAIIASSVNQPVGIALYFFTYSSWAARSVLNLHDIIVSKEFRGKGVGRHLIAYLAIKAKQEECCRIDLEVRSYNQARKFYEKLGFSQDTSNLIYEIDQNQFDILSQ
ncbi:MAG: GNAT family N-acetyltransferase [Rhodospirillaceae bacterium]|nr:GNAT family N-acetyltransferase [Rhodospirillaceae bacterium]